MVGGGKKKDDGSVGINSTNVFAALDSLRKKKKTDREHGSSKNKGSSSKAHAKEPEPLVVWPSTSLSGKSWADVDDEDDDYYATTAPPQAVWGSSELQENKGTSTPVEESESEEDGLDEGDDDIDVEEEQDNEPEVTVPSVHAVNKPSPATVVPKETEKQLSKKELKKKELAELEAVLAEFGIQNNNGQDEPHDSMQENKPEPNGNVTKKENAPALTESKSAKKKKAKKDKSSKDAKDPQDQPNGSDNTAADEGTGAGPVEEDTPAMDVKERLKKVASAKKKKSNKELDAAAKAAAIEAAARTSRLAAAKKKEKNHYNQQPVR